MPTTEINYATKDDFFLVQTEIRELRSDIKEFKDIMIQSFHFVYKRMDAMETKFEMKFDSVDKRFNQMDKRFDEIDKRFDEADKRFDRFEKSVGIQFVSVNAQLIAINTRLDNVIVETPRLTDHTRLVKRVEMVEKKVNLQVLPA